MTRAPAAGARAVPRPSRRPCRRVDEHGLALHQATPLVQAEVGEVERKEERRRVHVVELGRRLKGHGDRADDLLRVRPDRPRGGTRHALADPVLGPLARTDHLPYVLHAERVGQRGVDREVAAAAAVDLVVVAHRGRSPDQDLSRPRPRGRHRPELERLPWPAVADDLPCPHGRLADPTTHRTLPGGRSARCRR